jgi:hypothetical protein
VRGRWDTVPDLVGTTGWGCERCDGNRAGAGLGAMAWREMPTSGDDMGALGRKLIGQKESIIGG